MFLKYLGSIVENDSGKSTPLSDDMVPTPRHMEFSTNAELNLSCCILMLDILLKQVRFHVNIYIYVILALHRIVLFNEKAMCEKFGLGRWSFKIWISILELIHGFAEMLAI